MKGRKVNFLLYAMGQPDNAGTKFGPAMEQRRVTDRLDSLQFPTKSHI